MMPDFSNATRKLEFEKITQRIARLATTEPGKALCHTITPGIDAEWIADELQRVHEAKDVLIAEGTFPLEGLKDIRPHLRKTSVEHHLLTPLELLEIATCLRLSRIMHGFLVKRRDTAPALVHLAAGLHSDKIVEFNIGNAIEESGAIRDSASKELKLVRTDITALREQLRKRLETILRDVAEQELTQDEIITTRDGRFVIPVKTEFKHRVSGFIHSTSASGATVFIEPAETLDLNNAIRELQFREQREIDRILKDLTAQVAGIKDHLLESLEALARIDLLAAKARYSIEIIGSAPRVSPSGSMRLNDAYHPLLLQTHERSLVVPLSLEMNDSTRTIVITGPNAGGKSVALKTVGLSVLMAQAGIHLPSSADSEIPLITGVFVDMGDDQSIENDLSTFSSHLLHLRDILEHARPGSLVLIDEIGAGTDPAEGGALAASILKTLNDRHTFTIATTHHSGLKVCAHETAGMANASMEFDAVTLTPTYRFRFGMPGSSYALELAERMKFDRNVLDRARRALGDQANSVASLLLTLEKEIQRYRQGVLEQDAERTRLNALVRDYEKRINEVRNEVRSLRSKAREEARLLIEHAQATMERVVREIRESSASRGSILNAKAALQTVLTAVEKHEDPVAQPFNLRTGDTVRLRGTTEIGELTGVIGDTATVQWKNGTMKVQVRDLEPATNDGDKSSSTFFLPETNHELDLRGLSGDEAALKVTHFLEEAVASGLRTVDIIHGKGTGVLRKRITDILKHSPHIKAFRLGEWNEGGSGVTVVELADGEPA